MKATSFIKVGDFFHASIETAGGSKLRLKTNARTQAEARQLIEDARRLPRERMSFERARAFDAGSDFCSGHTADLLGGRTTPRGENRVKHIAGSDLKSVLKKMAQRGQWSQPLRVEQTPRVDLEKEADRLLAAAE